MPQPGIVLQARFGSARLRGKALALLAGRPVLEHCLMRLRAAGAGQVVLATTSRTEDDALVAVADRLRLPVFRGSADDVLGRYVAAARHFGLDPVIRATGDNPCVDVGASGRLLRTLRITGAEYVAEEGLPVGAGVEAVTLTALTRAAQAATEGEDREHVTTYVKRHPGVFRVAMRPAPEPLRRAGLRLTVDTADDLEYVRTLFARAGGSNPALRELIAAADAGRAQAPDTFAGHDASSYGARQCQHNGLAGRRHTCSVA